MNFGTNKTMSLERIKTVISGITYLNKKKVSTDTYAFEIAKKLYRWITFIPI